MPANKSKLRNLTPQVHNCQSSTLKGPRDSMCGLYKQNLQTSPSLENISLFTIEFEFLFNTVSYIKEK